MESEGEHVAGTVGRAVDRMGVKFFLTALKSEIIEQDRGWHLFV